jgi:hypothetical protein
VESVLVEDINGLQLVVEEEFIMYQTLVALVDLGMAVLLFLEDLILVQETVEMVLTVEMVQMLYRVVDLVVGEEVNPPLLELIVVVMVVRVSSSSHILHKYSKT